MANPRRTFKDALVEKRNVMSAVALRDVRSRFFNHGIGFFLVPLWPLVHMLVILAIYTVVGRRTPYGEDMATFFATGLLPTLTFSYVSRFMGVSLLNNRSMLAFPVVTTLDIISARAFLEIIGSNITLCLLIVLLTAYGSNPFPVDPHEACKAYLAVVVLSIGVGTLVSVISMIFKPFMIIYTLATIVVYLTSGTLFVASNLPDQVQYALSFSPVFHVVEWMRSSYYLGYGSVYLDKSYPVVFGVTSLFLGLLLERTARRAIKEG